MVGKVILVAVDASKEITDDALEWAVCNVIDSADSVVVLAVLPWRPTAANRINHFLSRLLKRWGPVSWQQKGCLFGESSIIYSDKNDLFHRINSACLNMMQQVCIAHNKQVHTEVQVLGNAYLGSIAAQARKLEATWVILDRNLKKEGDWCLKELKSCSVVMINHAIPKVLRAVDPPTEKTLAANGDQTDITVAQTLGWLPGNTLHHYSGTTHSSLGIDSQESDSDDSLSLSSAEKERFHMTTKKSDSNNPFLHLNSDYFCREVAEQGRFSLSCSYDKAQLLNNGLPCQSFDGKVKNYSVSSKIQCDKNEVNNMKDAKTRRRPVRRSIDSLLSLQSQGTANQSNQFITSMLSPTSTRGGQEEKLESTPCQNVERTSNIRLALSLSIKHPPSPPPLCSICKHDSPVFRKAPRKFSYREIEMATNGFPKENFLAEGGSGSVYKGRLGDGLLVAVKKHKMFTAQAASEFCSEVETLSCAQHKNLVTLVGYCIEVEWLLIYEFACNGSLDKHLYGETKEVMGWHSRMKVAIGAARGLRYLHEDCRVGCIVHRDFRANNILLTHDFEPMVGDFGLARWQADGQSAEETRIIGAFGYLAPEYMESGLITEKADVYAFGVVLLELLSGIKGTEFSRRTGQQFVQEWGRPLLRKKMVNEIVDDRLQGNYGENEVERVMYAAMLCISPNPEKRPRMSKVLKILDGDVAYSYGQHASSFPKQYASQSPIFSTFDHFHSSLPRQSVQHMKLISSTRSANENIDRKSRFRTLKPPEECKPVSGVSHLNQPDLNVSGRYQEYLEGSVAKFIRDLNDK